MHCAGARGAAVFRLPARSNETVAGPEYREACSPIYLFDRFARFGYRGFRGRLYEKAAEGLATRRVTRWLNDQIGEARALLERR
jgi:hypothetical protein